MNQCAFVVGNGEYPESPLKNPPNDATDITAKLENLGFGCITRINATGVDLGSALREFEKKLHDNEVGLFFFAGHGMQIKGQNYLAAVDTKFETEVAAKHSSLALDEVIDVMEASGTRTNIIILDACRNNPFERRWRGADEIRGLAPVYAPKGMIIAYATSPGQVASDGEGSNGAYTSALLHHIGTQNISIEDLFKRVRNTVSSTTDQRQISWEHTSLMGDFYFNYSLATGDFITEYSKEALADETFVPVNASLRQVVENLESLTWNIQNAGMSRLSAVSFSDLPKDDLFVLGRNIYQAACGTAHRAESYIDELEGRLAPLKKEVAFHILNGVLFEIYFDNRGRKRENAKADRFNEVFKAETNSDHSASFHFIQRALKPYAKELFYTPTAGNDVCINLVTALVLDDKRVVSAIFCEGDNVLYNQAGDGCFDPMREPQIAPLSKDQIDELLSRRMLTPKRHLRVTYADTLNDDVLILFPSRPNIRRYGK